MIALAQEVLYLSFRRVSASPVAEFRDPMELKPFGVRNEPGGRDADFVNRQQSAAVLKVVHERPAGGSLKPCSVMKRSVVVADGRVEAARADFKIVIRFVGDLQALDVEYPRVS